MWFGLCLLLYFQVYSSWLKWQLRQECQGGIFTEPSVSTQWKWSSCVPWAVCQIGQTPLAEQSRKLHFSELLCELTSPFCGTQKKHISFLSPWNAVTRLKQQIAVTNIQLVTSQYIFSRYFSTFWIFFCAKECYKQANLENKTQHVIVIIDNFKGQR